MMIFRRLFRFEPQAADAGKAGIGGDQQHQLTSVSRVGPFEPVDLKDSLRLRPGLKGSARTVRVRVVRLSALAVLAGVLAAVVPSLGLSGSKPTFDSASQECAGRVEYASGLEAVFGRRATHAQAITFR